MKKESLDIKLYREDYSKKKIVIINTHWNAEIIKPMVQDCLDTLREFKVNTHVLSVPGAYGLKHDYNNSKFSIKYETLKEVRVNSITVLPPLSRHQTDRENVHIV